MTERLAGKVAGISQRMKSDPTVLSADERRWTNNLLKACIGSSYNSFRKRYSRATTVLDQFRDRHRELSLLPGAEYLKFLFGHRLPETTLLLTALREAKSVANRENARARMANRWKENDGVRTASKYQSTSPEQSERFF